MGRFVNGEYYENFTKKPEVSNKITLEQAEFNKHDIEDVKIGIAIARAQIQKEKQSDIEMQEYIEAQERQEPIDYVIEDTSSYNLSNK